MSKFKCPKCGNKLPKLALLKANVICATCNTFVKPKTSQVVIPSITIPLAVFAANGAGVLLIAMPFIIVASVVIAYSIDYVPIENNDT